MSDWCLVLLMTFALIAGRTEPKEEIRAAVILPQDSKYVISLPRVLPVLELAATRVAYLLPNHYIKFLPSDDQCIPDHALKNAVMIKMCPEESRKLHVIFGPTCEYAVGREGTMEMSGCGESPRADEEECIAAATDIRESMDRCKQFWSDVHSESSIIPATLLKCPPSGDEDSLMTASNLAHLAWECMSQEDLEEMKVINKVLLTNGEIPVENLTTQVRRILSNALDAQSLKAALQNIDEDCDKALILVANQLLYIFNEDVPPRIVDEEIDVATKQNQRLKYESQQQEVRESSSARAKKQACKDIPERIRELKQDAQDRGLGEIKIPSAIYVSDHAKLALLEKQVRGRCKLSQSKARGNNQNIREGLNNNCQSNNYKRQDVNKRIKNARDMQNKIRAQRQKRNGYPSCEETVNIPVVNRGDPKTDVKSESVGKDVSPEYFAQSEYSFNNLENFMHDINQSEMNTTIRKENHQCNKEELASNIHENESSLKKEEEIFGELSAEGSDLLLRGNRENENNLSSTKSSDRFSFGTVKEVDLACKGEIASLGDSNLSMLKGKNETSVQSLKNVKKEISTLSVQQETTNATILEPTDMKVIDNAKNSTSGTNSTEERKEKFSLILSETMNEIRARTFPEISTETISMNRTIDTNNNNLEFILRDLSPRTKATFSGGQSLSSLDEIRNACRETVEDVIKISEAMLEKSCPSGDGIYKEAILSAREDNSDIINYVGNVSPERNDEFMEKQNLKESPKTSEYGSAAISRTSFSTQKKDFIGESEDKDDSEVNIEGYSSTSIEGEVGSVDYVSEEKVAEKLAKAQAEDKESTAEDEDDEDEDEIEDEDDVDDEEDEEEEGSTLEVSERSGSRSSVEKSSLSLDKTDQPAQVKKADKVVVEDSKGKESLAKEKKASSPRGGGVLYVTIFLGVLTATCFTDYGRNFISNVVVSNIKSNAIVCLDRAIEAMITLKSKLQ